MAEEKQNKETSENVESVNEEVNVEENEEKTSENQTFWNKVVSPVVGYGAFFGSLVIAVGIGLLVCLL